MLPSDDHDLVRDALLSSEVRKFSFTGSTETVCFFTTFQATFPANKYTSTRNQGKLLAETAIGSNLKRLSLELGGNAPFVIFEDADMEQASKGTCYTH